MSINGDIPKIEELQKQRVALADEGNEKIKMLEFKREQLSGMYTGLYQQYTAFVDEKDSNESIKVEESKEHTTKKSTTTKLKTAKKKQEKAELSEEEKAKLSEIVVQEQPKNEPNNSDIPDYLKDEYNK